MSANNLTILFAYLHPGDASLFELLVILLAWLAALAFPVLLIGVFVWVVVRPKEEVLSVKDIESDEGK